MPVLAEIVAAPVLAAIAAVVATHAPPEKPADPCRPPAIRLESANLAALPGPNSPACMEARKAQAAAEKDAAKTQKAP
jgi:hypothetical protein